MAPQFDVRCSMFDVRRSHSRLNVGRWTLDVERSIRNLPLLLVLLFSGCRHNKGPETQPSDNPRAIPPDAKLITQLTGRGIFVAEDNGTVFILDDRDHLLASADMRINQRLIFYPEQSQIILDGQVIYQGRLNKDHVYRFYFSKGS
jgi:hypothetical protein